jgi:predicted esterase
MVDSTRHCNFSARLDCHYLLQAPETVDSDTALVVTLHGFGQTAEAMLNLTRKTVGPRHVIASIQGPNQFFLDGKTMQVGYCWNTNRHAASSIRLHHDMVLQVLDEAGRELDIPPSRRVLCGFSQPVALNYRFAATFPSAIRGVVAMCGGIPGDWESASYQPVTAAVLHIARREDEYYPPAITEQYPRKLRLRIEDLEFHLIDGGHRVPSQGRAIVEGWLGRILR